MKTITITLSINVPDDVEVDVKTETVDASLPKPIRVQRSRDLTVPPPTPSRYGVRRWTDAEDEYVRDASLTAAELATVLERTEHAIRHRRYQLGINISGRSRNLPEVTNGMRRWSEEEDAALKALGMAIGDGRAKTADLQPIADVMGRSVGAIRTRFNMLRRNS